VSAIALPSGFVSEQYIGFPKESVAQQSVGVENLAGLIF